jgi:hypothetical protein
VYYSENKVKNGTAEYVCAVNFLQQIDKMTPEEKIQFLEKRNLLDERCKANTPHIILAFDPSEKFTKEKFAAIATAFMDGIGFGQQPYLVYLHKDTRSPHLHIATTLIRADGSRIETHNIAIEKCEPTRIRVEQQFGLIKAKGRRQQKEDGAGQARAKKVIYGQSETYSSVAKAVQEAIDQFIFTTLGEFNAVLKQYNVFAETGKKGSKTAQNGGLYYRVLDAEGKAIGIPIKASELPGRPTLKFLRTLFDQNLGRKQKALNSIRIRVEWALKQRSKNLAEFKEILLREGIKAILWQNETGWTYGITFLDQKTKTAVNGRDLGPGMGVSALQASWSGNPVAQSSSRQNSQNPGDNQERVAPTGSGGHAFHDTQEMAMAQLIELLLQPTNSDDWLPYELSAKKKKRKSKPPHS